MRLELSRKNLLPERGIILVTVRVVEGESDVVSGLKAVKDDCLLVAGGDELVAAVGFHDRAETAD